MTMLYTQKNNVIHQLQRYHMHLVILPGCAQHHRYTHQPKLHTSPAPHTVLGCHTLHLGTTNPTFMSLINEISWKFSTTQAPHHRPHTYSWDASPFARIDGFWWVPEIDFCYETETRKVMLDFKFDALYR